MSLPDWKSALARHEKAPVYRFRGHLAPSELPRTPILDRADATLQDGVATIRLYDPIDSWGGEWGVSAKEFVGVLDQLHDAKEIRLHINSPGGEVFEAIAIMNALRAHPAKVVATVDGIAASSASFIAASADETVMARNAEMMIHDAWGVAIGNAADMRQLGDLLDHLSDNIASVYAEKAGGAVEEWRTQMLAETWLSAQQSVDAGLANSILAPAPAEPEKVEARAEIVAERGPELTDLPPGTKIPAEPAAEADERVLRFMARRADARRAKVA